MPLQPGQMLNNRYRIVRELGKGGFGAVYRAWDTNLSRPCAVKENLETSPEAQRQFAREASVLANLSHTNLPRVTDHFSIAGQGQYLVMDYVDGEDLAHKLEQGGVLPVEQALSWAIQVADALEYLHNRPSPVIHRDIKPANIRITPEGRAMLVDFGLVKVSQPHMKTTVGARAVTPGYAPPEQYGQGSTDPRSDLYALGATLYTMLTNQQPVDSLQRMMGKPLSPVEQINSRIPSKLSQVIERAMAIDAGQRYQTAQDFRSALSSSIPTLPGGAALQASSEETLIANPISEMQIQAAIAERRQASPARQPDAPAAPAWSPQAVSPAAPALKPAAAAPKPTSRLWVWGGAIAVIVVCLVSGISLYAYFSQAGGTSLSDDDFRATLEARVQMTSTAYAHLTATALNQATPTARTTPTDDQTSAQLTQQASEEIVKKAIENRQLLLSSQQGSLAHDPESKLIAGQALGVDLQNFILEVRFYNPYAAAQANWDVGFFFRHVGANQHFRLIIRSDRTWVLSQHAGQPNGNLITQGVIPEMNVERGGWNQFALYCIDSRGFLYVNSQFIAEFDLSARLNSGDIYLVTGAYEGNQVQGEKTDYQELNLWSVP